MYNMMAVGNTEEWYIWKLLREYILKDLSWKKQHYFDIYIR